MLKAVVQEVSTLILSHDADACYILQIGMSESTVFKNFHPDAEHLYNMCMDMKEVFTTLKDKKTRIKRKVQLTALL